MFVYIWSFSTKSEKSTSILFVLFLFPFILLIYWFIGSFLFLLLFLNSDHLINNWLKLHCEFWQSFHNLCFLRVKLHVCVLNELFQNLTQSWVKWIIETFHTGVEILYF